jgi:hypothetical protein
MSLAITAASTVIDSTRSLAHIYAKLTITDTVTYPGSNGEIFDPSVLFPSGYKCAPKLPISVDVIGGGNDFVYAYVPSTTLALGKLKVLVMSTGLEHATASYDAAILADTNIRIHVVAYKA